MKIQLIKHNKLFIINSQRILRLMNKIVLLKKSDKILPEQSGELFIIYNGCRQMILNTNTEVDLNNSLS